MGEMEPVNDFLARLERNGQLEGFTGLKPQEKEASMALARSETNPDFRGFEIENAKFGVNITRSGENTGLQINFPSRNVFYTFEYLESVVNGIIESGFPSRAHKPSPYVKFTRDRGTIIELDLKSAWDLRKYERELEKGNFTTVSFRFSDEKAEVLFGKQEDKSGFTYGFRKGNVTNPQSHEFLHLTPKRIKAGSLNNELFKDVLHRHADYLGKDDEADLEEFSDQITRIFEEAFPEKPSTIEQLPESTQKDQAHPGPDQQKSSG